MLAQITAPHHGAQRTRVSEHLLAQLVCLGSHTITNVLSARGRQFEDWTADYRMYERNRVSAEQLFAVVRTRLCATHDGPVVIALDDTRVRKAGKKTYGAKYVRDPLSPPFHTNFIRAQRFIQTSMACMSGGGQARMVPVDWKHAPTPPKPRAKACAEQWDDYKAQCKVASMSRAGVERIDQMRTWLDDTAGKERALWCVVDGSFTNRTVLKQLPHNTVFVGRVRSDARLNYLPDTQPQGQGRRRSYGPAAPTPDQLRQDDGHPWQSVQVYFGGALRSLRAKKLAPVRWSAAGGGLTFQLIVIAPTPYQLTQGGKLLYRQPAYLLCSQPDAPIEQVIQHYLWRWDIETNFRDQKTLLGLGEAQVRKANAVQNVTGLAVAAYAMLLTAADGCRRANTPIQHLPAPKWRRKPTQRVTTMNLIQNLRYELWAKAIHFTGFEQTRHRETKPQKKHCPLKPALFYASRYS